MRKLFFYGDLMDDKKILEYKKKVKLAQCWCLTIGFGLGVHFVIVIDFVYSLTGGII